MDAGEIAMAISNGDAKKLQTIPGVGKRMSERMALELKDKVKGFVGLPDSAEGAASPTQSNLPVGSGAIIDTVVEALVGLGFTEKAARPVVEAHVGESEDLDKLETAVILRASLSSLSVSK